MRRARKGWVGEFGLSKKGYLLSDDTGPGDSFELRLQRLTGLERDKIVTEYRELLEKITDPMDIPRSSRTDHPDHRRGAECGEGAVRRQASLGRSSCNTQDLGIEDLITPQDMVVTLSHTGYIKSQPLGDYRAQRRGGRGKPAAATKRRRFRRPPVRRQHARLHPVLPNRGRVYWIKVYEVPQGSRNSRGKPIVNMFPLEKARRSTPSCRSKEFAQDRFIFMATSRARSRRPRVRVLEPAQGRHHCRCARRRGLPDRAEITNGENDIVLVSDAGRAVWFDERPCAWAGGAGVRGDETRQGAATVAAGRRGTNSRQCWLPPRTVRQTYRTGRLHVIPVVAHPGVMAIKTSRQKRQGGGRQAGDR